MDTGMIAHPRPDRVAAHDSPPDDGARTGAPFVA